MGKEFLNINGNVKDKLIRVTGNIALLEAYLSENKDKLSASEIGHFQNRIKVMRKMNQLAEQNRTDPTRRKPLIAPVERKDGTIELAHIHQHKVQNTWNGCWSVSLQLLLQSRGVQLTQEQIRSFRTDITDKEVAEGLEGEEEINLDKKATIDKKADLVMKLLPNTAFNQMNFSGDKEGRKFETEAFKQVVTKALVEDCSPISMVINGHFRTIVGIKGDELLLKDSLQFRVHGADHTYKVSINEILEKAGQDRGLEISWLHDMKLEKDGTCAEFSHYQGLSYKNGEIQYEGIEQLTTSEQSNKNRELTAYGGEESWIKEAHYFRAETRSMENKYGDYAEINMILPKKLEPVEPRKIRKYTELEIDLIDKLKEREKLEDIQIKLNTPNENGLYPAMTEEDLKQLDAAYAKVSKMYEHILSQKDVKISETQRVRMSSLKADADRERELLSKLEKTQDGLYPSYHDALSPGEMTPYQRKMQSLENLEKKFADLDKKGHKNSKEYTDMLTSFAQFRQAMREKDSPEKQFSVQKAQAAALSAVQNYIKEKGNPYTSFGKNRLTAALELQEELGKNVSHLFEKSMDELMKEQARLKEELSKIKPPFSAEQLKTLWNKFEPGSQMYAAGAKAIAALETLGNMKYRKDHPNPNEKTMTDEEIAKKERADLDRFKDSLAKMAAFVMLSDKDLDKNTFSEKYVQNIAKGLKEANAFDGQTMEQWFDLLEKGEGIENLKQICAKYNETEMIFSERLEELENVDKTYQAGIENRYQMYEPEKFGIKLPENAGLGEKELGLLTIVKFTGVKEEDIPKAKEELSSLLKDFAEGRKEPMQQFIVKAIPAFTPKNGPENGLTEKTKVNIKIASDICEMLNEHPDLIPEGVKVSSMYRGLKECSKIIEEAAQARKEIAEINFNKLESGSDREKLKDVLLKLCAERVINSEISNSYEKQAKKNAEVIRYPGVVPHLNETTKPKLMELIKNSKTFEKAVSLMDNLKVRDKFIFQNESFMEQIEREFEKSSLNIAKELAPPKEEIKKQQEPTVKKAEEGLVRY